MTTTPRNKIVVVGIMVALAALIFVVDALTPQDWTSAPLFIPVVGACLWLAGRRPIFLTAFACTLLTVLGHFVAPPGPLGADLFNRTCSILAIWVMALFCVLYKRTEQQSLELAAIVASSDDAIFSRTLDNVITSWNRGAQRLFGYAAEEILGRPGSLLLPPDRLDEQARIIEKIMRGERVAHFESVRVRKDGSQVPVSLSASPITEPGGTVVGFSTIARDFTKQKRAAEELQQRAQESAEAEERMHSVVNHVVDGIITIDDRGTVTTFNPAAERIFGYAAQEVVGQNIKMVMAEPYQSQHDGYLANYLRTGQAKIIGIGREVVGRRKNGLTFPLDLAISAFRLGQRRYFTGIVRDITERRRAEEALRESEERFRGTFENAAVGIAHEDLNGRFLRLNETFCRILGYPHEELVGKTPSDVTYPEDLEADLAKFGALTRRESSSYTMEKRFIRKDGTLVWAHLTASLQFDAAGKPDSCIKIIEDISDRKVLDEELQKAKEAAEAASRAKSEFLASMSHEIRTPMNGVFGMLDLALETELPPEQRHYLERARASADLLLRVINDILDFSKIEAGRLDLEPTAFSLGESLGETIKGFGPQAHRKGLELALHVQPETPDGLVGDGLRLGQVLINLLGNAIKFTERGEVVLEAGVESVTEGQVYLHFAVTDTGPGIPPDKQRLIFAAFAQADSSMARRFGGTGLGLAISARLVELMGGRIWVESEVGKGSTFHFTARFALQREAVVKPKAQRIDLEGMPVLVADDNETNRRILSEMLATWRMGPTAVGGGRAALAELKRAAAAGDPFPLVLLDAVMPDLDGFAVAREIKHDPALAGATVMMLSSADGAGELARCQELGIAAFLRKPVKQSELLDAVLKALGGLAALPETAPAPASVALPGGRRGFRVLVVEDNEFNQDVVASLLTKRGHVAVLAPNGKSALAAWEREPFDLILMDVQMPEMDGFAATEAIRTKERSTNDHIPIIALTAHAMKGDRERCLAAGMDAYVSKPIRAAELFEAISRLLSLHVERAQERPVSEGPQQAVFDLDNALSGVGGDQELLGRMARWFLNQCPKLLGEIHDAVLRGDAPALEHAAHTLKASVGSFGAQRAYEAAQQLEELGSAGDLIGSKNAFPALVEAVKRLQEVVTDLAREGQTGGAHNE
jgi:two-component system, sensor histidine kinase and response regulator